MIYQIAERHHITGIRKLLLDVFGESYADKVDADLDRMVSNKIRKSIFVIGLNDQNIVAVCSFSEQLFTVDVWGIGWVAVHPDHRRKGICREIIEKAVGFIEELGGPNAHIILNADSDGASMYKNMGFREIGVLDNENILLIWDRN